MDRVMPPPDRVTPPPGAIRALATLRGGPTGAELRRLAAAIEAAPPHRQSAVAAAAAVASPVLRHLAPPDARQRVLEAVPEAYRQAPTELLARLVLGEPPVALSDGLLSRQQAHEWLQEAHRASAAQWLLARVGVPQDCVRDVPTPVARWVAARMAVPEQRAALERTRAETVAGVRVEGRYLDRLDELRESDLRPSVEATFRSVAERLRADTECRVAQMRGDPLAPPPRWWRPARCARLLLTGPELAEEGRALRHCVATYAPLVHARRAVVVALRVAEHRSTVELDPQTAAVRQHRGVANTAPPELCRRALEVLARRWQAAARG